MRIIPKLFALVLLVSAPLTPLMARAQQAYLTDGTSTVVATSSQTGVTAYMNQEATLSGESKDPVTASSSPKGFFARFFIWLGGFF